jgi:heterodisulfide reductase subunit B
MAKEYSFYPGCSSQTKASSANYLVSAESLAQKLDFKLNHISDWNCCGASIGYAEGGELPRLALSARNMALSEQEHPGQDIVATCAACWLATREAKERLHEKPQLMQEANEALKECNLQYKGDKAVRHMVEVLIEDIGYDALNKKVVKPIEGVKIASYVGCQTNRPFGINGESFENPVYLDKMMDAMGATSLPKYEQKVTCCGGALAFSEPERSQAQIKMIIESAYDHGADMIVTPCPLCQANVELYQGQVNKRFGTKFKIPVVLYTQVMTVAMGGSAKEAALNGQVIRATQLEEIAAK